MTPLPSPTEVRARLDAIRAARGGFLLPHHGVLIAVLPDLHTAYEGENGGEKVGHGSGG